MSGQSHTDIDGDFSIWCLYAAWRRTQTSDDSPSKLNGNQARPAPIRAGHVMMRTVHLTCTGVHAGATLCGSERSPQGHYAHAAYAPIGLPTFRAECCPECLIIWEGEAVDSDAPKQLVLFEDPIAASGNI